MKRSAQGITPGAQERDAMANAQHAEILKRGVAAWEAWRRANREIKPDLFGLDLRGATLKDADLGEVNQRRG
jgi:hypothetical protein